MRRLLLIVDAGIGALCLVMALVQAVVCLLYAFVLDESPRLGAQLPLLIASTLVFLVVGLAFVGAFVGLLRARPWRWLLQGAVIAGLVPAGVALYRLMT